MGIQATLFNMSLQKYFDCDFCPNQLHRTASVKCSSMQLTGQGVRDANDDIQQAFANGAPSEPLATVDQFFAIWLPFLGTAFKVNFLIK